MSQRHYLLGFALFITIVAAIFPNQDKPVEIVETTSVRTAKPINTLQSVSVVQSVDLNPRQWVVEKDSRDLFYVKPKIVEVPVQPKREVSIVVESPPPVAPPLPFIYLGKMTEEGQITVYVAKSGRNYVLRGGEIIDGMYKVELIDAQKIIFNYIPLNSEQILVTRGAN